MTRYSELIDPGVAVTFPPAPCYVDGRFFGGAR